MTGVVARLRDNHDFVRLTILRGCMLASLQTAQIAVSWQAYVRTGEVLALGLIGLVQFVVVLAITPISGTVADRFDRRVTIVVTTGLAGVTTFALIPAGAAPGRDLDWLLVVMAVLTAFRSLTLPAVNSLTPLIVPRIQLRRAIAISSSVNKLALVVAPAVGGLLLAVSAEVNYIVSALLLLIAAALAITMRSPPIRIPRTPLSVRDLFGGVAVVWRNPLLSGAISLDFFATLLGGATALLPIYVHDILHGGPDLLGVLRSTPAMGSILVSLWMTRAPLGAWAGRAMIGGIAFSGLAIIVFGVSTNVLLSAGALAVMGAAETVSAIVRQTIVQLAVPDEVRGRVSALSAASINASNTLGQFESAATAALLGTVPAVVMGGILSIAVAVLWSRRVPGLLAVDLSRTGSVEATLAKSDEEIFKPV